MRAIDPGAMLSRWHGRPARQVRRLPASLRSGMIVIALTLLSTGCTSWQDYVHNGFKVGPNYREPCTATAANWIDTGNPHINNAAPNDAAWWQAMNDPVLNALISTAYHQNLTLRIAGWRIMEARCSGTSRRAICFPRPSRPTAATRG